MKTIPSFRSCASNTRPLPMPTPAVRSWRMQTGWLSLCLGALLWCAGIRQAQCQGITLGGAEFAATSDRVPADWYVPMLSDVTKTYEGYGANAGATRTEAFSRGETVSGVKCIKWHVVTNAANAAGATVEDWWLAVDTAGDVRVIKRWGTALQYFDALEPRVAPVFLPGNCTGNPTWELFGRTLTVVSVGESQVTGVLQLKSEAAGTPVRLETFEAGTGLVCIVTNGVVPEEASGWRRVTGPAQ